MPDAQNTLRETLEANMDAATAGTLNAAPDAPVIESTPAVPDAPADPVDGKTRDDQGRFAAPNPVAATPAPAPADVPAEPAASTPPPDRPTTWKKEFLPIWDKLATGAPLDADESRKLAAYSQQREREFATGVSTYRAEAQNAAALRAAIDPFVPTLQKHNIDPSQWITNLGNAHQALALGSPQQKIQMFATLAQQYGVPLSAITQGATGQLDPVVPQLMQQIQSLTEQVNAVAGRHAQQDQQAVHQQIAKFGDAEKYPHFEQVRGDMAQLLETGLAQDLDGAYAKAVRMNDATWAAEQARQAPLSPPVPAPSAPAAVAKAKAAAGSVRSVTPSGATSAVDPSDRRSTLVSRFDAMMSGRV